MTILHKLFAGKGSFWLAATVLLLTTSLLEYHILQSTNNTISFPLDEAFTRLAVAKNLAFHGVWGLSKDAFSSASPTLLYPILLAVIFFLFGACPIIAILVNLAAAIAVLWFIQRWIAQQELTYFAQTLILLAVVLLTPLPVIVVSGMEYTLQLLLSFLFITTVYNAHSTGRSLASSTYLLAALLVANRYESILLVAAACILLITQQNSRAALKLGLFALLPVILFGIIAVRKDHYLIPYPLLLQSDAPAGIFTALYPAWAIGNAVVFGGVLLAKYAQTLFKKAAVLFIILLASLHGITAFQNTRAGCINTYQQSYQAGELLRRYYKRWPIALDNIGAPAFLSEGNDIDLRQYTTCYRDSLSRRRYADMAIYHDQKQWHLPSQRQWIKVASWTMPDNITSKYPTLSIYVNDSSYIKRLKINLLDFQPHLPPDISVKYY